MKALLIRLKENQFLPASTLEFFSSSNTLLLSFHLDRLNFNGHARVECINRIGKKITRELQKNNLLKLFNPSRNASVFNIVTAKSMQTNLKSA
jgi:hypothetical protein